VRHEGQRPRGTHLRSHGGRMFVCKAEKVRTEVRFCLLQPAASSKCVRREDKEGSSKKSDKLVQSLSLWPICRGKPDSKCSFLLLSSPPYPDRSPGSPQDHSRNAHMTCKMHSTTLLKMWAFKSSSERIRRKDHECDISQLSHILVDRLVATLNRYISLTGTRSATIK
jgi:hypothetical protein